MTRSLIRWLRQYLASSQPRSLAQQTVRTGHPIPVQGDAKTALRTPTTPPPEREKHNPAKANRAPATRIIEWETAANGSARTLGRVVMVGKFSEICAELDRLAALEMA